MALLFSTYWSAALRVFDNYKGAINAMKIFTLLVKTNPEAAEIPIRLYKSSFKKESLVGDKIWLSPEQIILQVAASLLKGMNIFYLIL
jgi:hypothetical protein